MPEYLIEKQTLDGLANSIRTKAETTTSMTPEEMIENIDNITTLNEGTADATATASQILSGATAYVKGAKVTGNIATQAATTITPGTSNQTAVAAGKYTTGAVTVAGDADLTAANIKSGVNIFNVAGTFTSDATATAEDIVSGKTAYVNGAKVTGTASLGGGTRFGNGVGQISSFELMFCAGGDPTNYVRPI